MTESQSEAPSSLPHPIKQMIRKISELLRCVYKRRLEKLGVSVDKIDFNNEPLDIEMLQKVGD